MRERVLRLLLEHPNAYLSGEAISERLGVSRAAVWKHIQALKEQGFQIEAVTRRGYCLRQTDDGLHPALISMRLRTQALGHSLGMLQSVPSTNIVARELAQQGCAHGAVVVAERQTAGKGRLGRAWTGAPGKDICLSIVLRPRLAPQYAPRFTLATALGVYRLVAGLGLLPFIKWPNDVLIAGRKVCGILLEMSGDLDHLDAIIVGIGLNVNTEVFPEEISDKAISLLQAAGHPVSRAETLAQLLNELEPLYLQCNEDQAFQTLLKEYARCCITVGRNVAVTGVSGTLEGYAEGIDEIGRLLLRTDDGTRHALSAGDVTLRTQKEG